MTTLATLARDGLEVVRLAERLAAGNVPSVEALGAAHLLAPMRGAPHDPVHHAEGDPLVHTHMVACELVRRPGFEMVAATQRLALALAALLHDVAKPETADEVDGRVSHPNHAPRGARKARAALYAAGLDPRVREAAAALCRRHMQPHHILATAASDVALLRWVASVSLEVPVRLLLLLAEADARGRVSARPDDSAALLRDFAGEHDILDAPHAFADRTVRCACCRDADRDPRFASGAPEGGPLVRVLTGLPASGKSGVAMALAAEGAVRISVEDRLDAGMERGRAIQDAKEVLRECLRTGRDAVWDATMLTRTLRRQVVGLVETYGARCAIQTLEVPEVTRAARNRERDRPVPDDVVVKMLSTWEMPTFDEALIVEGRPDRLSSNVQLAARR
ncbi:MAG: AAA family ATPase [Pseudomonadota bacterium]